MKRYRHALLAGLVLAGACRDGDGSAEARASAPEQPRAAEVYWDRKERRLSAEELERGRMDMSWAQTVQLDTTGAGAVRPIPERWEQISAQTVNTGPMHLPIAGDVGGPSVLRVQVLLDRALFSPGIMDGRWGKNTAQAVYWFQKQQGLPGTARMDSATFARLTEAGGKPAELVRSHTLSAADVKGPFTRIPDDIYEHARLECSCYESLGEKLSEMFHATPEVLQQLNPGVRLDDLRAGQTIQVPNVRGDRSASRGEVAELVVSGRGSYVHALDAQGRILYHFPSTLGAKYSPSPSGRFAINAVAQDPSWHYQPALLTGVPDDEEDAMIPAGPNNAVGVVWMDLSEPHYGIHGTSSPETIGYATSHGCVRLTNWDAEFLSHQVRKGLPVHFRDIVGEAKPGDDAAATAGEDGGVSSTPERAPATPEKPRASGEGASTSGSRAASPAAPGREGTRDSARASGGSRGGTRTGTAQADTGRKS
jgi:hypothetical protein